MHCEHLQMLLQSSNQILTISLKFLANQTIQLEVNTSEYEKKKLKIPSQANPIYKDKPQAPAYHLFPKQKKYPNLNPC